MRAIPYSWALLRLRAQCNQPLKPLRRFLPLSAHLPPVRYHSTSYSTPYSGSASQTLRHFHALIENPSHRSCGRLHHRPRRPPL